MDPRDKPRIPDPEIEPQENEIDAVETVPDSIPDPEDLPPGIEEDGAAPESQDDDAYQNSDEALPDDAEERAINRDLYREGGRFGEV
ncbi:MAG: hypothetical protein QHC90_03150 [Shinella sp.]|nr:hypothetical protein [Shinella sp.]